MSEGAVGTVPKRCLIVLLLVTVLSLPAGCVYYNTFYHAQAADVLIKFPKIEPKSGIRAICCRQRSMFRLPEALLSR